jgi:hypothetical protein
MAKGYQIAKAVKEVGSGINDHLPRISEPKRLSGISPFKKNSILKEVSSMAERDASDQEKKKRQRQRKTKQTLTRAVPHICLGGAETAANLRPWTNWQKRSWC